VNGIGDAASLGEPNTGTGGSLYFFANAIDIRRWPPLPGQTDTEVICNPDTADILAIHDRYVYVSYATQISVNEGTPVDIHGIGKIDMETHAISDAVSADPDPTPTALVWDHNGTLYICGDSWTPGSPNDHYETNLFKKWTGSQWVSVGGGLHVLDTGHSKVLRMATDGTNIYLGGAFVGAKNGSTVVNSTNIIRWNVDTGLWTGMADFQSTIGRTGSPCPARTCLSPANLTAAWHDIPMWMAALNLSAHRTASAKMSSL
jgi:hypothetical protein